MDDKIYPLKIGEGAPVLIRPREKKPQLKANLKERKKLIAIVAAVAVLAIGSVVYGTGIFGNIFESIFNFGKGNISSINNDVSFSKNTSFFQDNSGEIDDEGGPIIFINTPNLDYPYNQDLGSIVNMGTKAYEYKVYVTAKNQSTSCYGEGSVSEGSSGKINLANYSCQDIVQGEYKVSISVRDGNESEIIDSFYLILGEKPPPSSPSPTQPDSSAIEYLPLVNENLLSGIETPIQDYSAMVTPVINNVTIIASPASTQTVGSESSFTVNASGGSSPYNYYCRMNYGDGSATETVTPPVTYSSCSFKHKYTKTGTYTVSATVFISNTTPLVFKSTGIIYNVTPVAVADPQALDLVITGSIVGSTQVAYGQPVTLNISANRDSTINKVEIYSNAGTLKKELTAPKNLYWDGTSKQIIWDGKDTAGQYVSAGAYKFKISAQYTKPNPAAPGNLSYAKTAEVSFNITAPQPVLKISATPSVVEAGKEVSFALLMEGGTFSSYPYSISYGDGITEGPIQSNTSASYVFKHTYQSKGTYPVVARMTTSGGIVIKSETYSYTVTESQVSTDLSLLLSVTPSDSQKVGEKVTFTLKRTGGTGTYKYRMFYGDQKNDETAYISSDTATFDHTYTAEGPYKAQGYIINASNVNKLSNEITYTITKDATLVTTQCNDLLDNDTDGKIDFPTDTGCTSPTDNSESLDPDPTTPPPPTYQCSDDVDNDGDGKVDYPNDTGCSSATDNTENSEGTTTPTTPSTPTTPTPPPTSSKETKCDDGKDNDGDNKIDYADSDCKVPSTASMKITDVGVTSPTFNPIIGATKIYYKLSDTANTKVKILNSSGSELVTLFDGKQEQQSGSFSIWWEGTLNNSPTGQKVPNGTYTYKIEATHTKYPTVKDSKQGTIIVDSAYNPGGLDFEDPQAPQAPQQQTIQPPQNTQQSQNQATQALQNSTTGNTAGTGPEVIFYFLFPALAFACQKISKNK